MVSHRVNSDGLPQYHLRRIGRRPSLPDVGNFIDFKKRVTLIGRNREVVDYILISANESCNRSISRIHARVIRALPSNRHRLVDSSCTGVYFNDRWLAGDVILSEGDTVTFGHPQSSRLDRGERIRQPNSEFHFMFELCDCELGQGTEQGQGPRPCTTPLMQTPLILPAACPRFPTPALLLGAVSGLMPGQLSPMGDTGGMMALHDLGKPTAVTEVREHGVQWLSFAHCGPERMELANQGHDSADPDAPLPVTLAQPSLVPISVTGDNPIASGSRAGVHLDSQTQGRGLFPPVILAVWNEHLNEPTVSGDGESSRRQLPDSHKRLSSGEAGQLLSEGWEARASPYGQGGGAGAKRHCTSLSMSRCCREGSRHEGEASLPADASILQEGICTSPLSCPNIVQGGSSFRSAQDEIQGKMQGATMNIAHSSGEPAVGMGWAVPINKALPDDTSRIDAALPDDTDVSKATGAADPRLDPDTTGQFNLCQGEDTLTEFTVQDTQELESSGSSIGEACRDSVSSVCQTGENELHVHNEDCHLQPSKGRDLVMGSISFYKAAQGQDSPTRSIVENTSATDTPAPLRKRQHDAMRNSPEDTHVQRYSTPNKSPRAQTPESSGNLGKKLKVICLSRVVPGQDLLLEGRLATAYVGNKKSGGLPGDPQRLLADPAWAEEELPLSTAAVSPITVDAEFTALNGESVDASLDGDHLVEAQATADMIGDYTRPAGRSVCENGDQHLSDHFHGCTIVGDKQETINIPALWTQAHNSLPKAVSGLLTKQMEKDGNLINSETPEGLGFMVESQVAHKQKAVSVGRSQCIKPAENGMSSVQSPATVSDTLWAKFTTLDGCVPKADSSTCVAEAKPESKMAVEMAGVKSNFPMNSLSTFGSSNEGAKNGDDQWVMPTMKLCSSLVGSGLIDLKGAQEHVSTVGQPMEGHCVCATDQRGLETGVSGTEKGVSGMEMVVSGELEAGVSGELEMGVSGELETGVSGMETSVSGELETGVSGELETGMSGVETGVSGELEMGVSGELKTGVSGVETGVSGELEMGVSGELEMGVSGELEKGVSGMEMGVSGELETGVSGELEMGVSGMEIGVSEELKMGVSGMEMGVSGMETGVSGMETGVSGKLETSVSGELEASVSGELETGVSGLLETGVSGELETGVSGELKTGVSGKLETDVSGELETGVSGELETGVSGMKTGVSGELKTGVSGELETGVSGDLKTGVSGDLKTGVSGELETGVSGELETGLSGELETGVSGELETGVSGKLEMSVSGELETGVSGELETGVSGMETGVSEELETGVSGKLEMSVSGELETGVLGDLKTGVSGELETGVSGELETGVSGMETGVSGELETGVSGKLEMSVSGELEMGVSGELETGVSGMETGVSGELETGVSGKLEMSVSGELETGVSGELETGVSGMETGVSEELEIGVSGKLEMSVSGELETGVSGELETGVSGELKTGVSVELKTGVLGELETGVSGDLKTGVSGELETGVLGELETGVSGELETGLSGELETGVSGELETGVSGELETGVSGMEMGVSGELKTGVSGELETGVSGELETGVSGELEMGVSGELEMGVSGMEMGVSGELETGVSGELETGVSGVETGVSGELETGVSGELETGVSGELETGVSGELETGVSGELQTGVSGMETGVSGELEMGVSGMETGVSGELETGVSGELETGLSGELETGVSGELQTGLSGMETGVSGELAMGVSGMETGVSGELEMGVSGELEMGVSVELKTGVLGELETGVSGELETGVSGELKTGVSGELKMGVSVELKTGVSGELETGVSGELETGVSGELETGVSGELETGVSGELETGVSGELETGVSGELKTGVSGMETGVSGELETGLSGMETGVSGELETGVSWELETGVSGELETGVSGELETGVSGELETGVSGELETGVSGELETGVSGMETGVSGELEMGVSGELETGVSGELETGVSGELETGVSGELETGVSGELETGVSGELETGVSGELEMGVSGELKTGVSGELKTGVSGMETGVSGELETGLSGMETGVSGELKTGVSWELETGVSGELETGVSGELETGVSGELETGVSGELAMGVSGMETGVSGMETGVSGELETGVSGELETGVSVELKTGVSGELETGVSGELETGVSGELKTGVSGELKTGVSGELETGVSGELETGVSVELKTGVSGELETGVSGELETGVSGELETGVSGELETGVSGELETGVSGMETGVSGELEMGVSGMETGVSGELEMGVSGMEMGVSGLETGVSGLEMGVSRMETGASGVEMGVSGIESGVETGVSGMETGVSGELETGVSGMETGVSGELETGVSGMETGVSQVPDKCEQSDDLRRDSGLLPLEQIMCQNIVMESEIATLGRVERVCDIGIGVTHVSVKQCGPYGAEGDSDSKDASVTLDLSPKSDAEELGDPTKMDKSVEVDPVPECTGGKMDVINLHPKAVARNVPSTDVEATASSTILECDVINKPKLPEPSAAVSADTEMQQEVSRRGRVDAHSELEQTESLAMAPWLSACVEPESHRGEDGGVLPECSALTVTFHTSGVQVCEAVDLLMPAGDPVAALVKLNATVAPDSVAGVPPWCVSLPSSATASSPTQTERPSQAGTEMAGEQRCSEHLALEQPACGVPSSVTVGLEGDGSLRYLVGPPGSQNVLRQGEDSGPSLTEVHPTGQNVEGNPPLVPEDREGVNKLESEPAKERYLVSQNLATRTVPGATAVLGGHREDFTVTGKMELDSNSMEDGAKFYPCKDCEQGASSLMETSKYEATEGVNQELCLVQWMHPGVLGMSDTERFSLSSAPLEGCGQGKEAKTAGSPLTALGKVPTGWRTAANTPTSLGLTVTEGGTDTTVPHSPASEGGTDTPTSLGLPVSEGGTDTPTSLGLPVPEGGTDTPMSLGLTVPEGGTDTTVPHSPASEGGTDTPTSLGLTVPEGGTGTPMLLGLPVPEGGTDTTVPHSPASEGGTDTPMSLGLTVPEGGADTTVPHSPVPEGGTDITAPWGPVPEGRTDITAPRGHSVHEGGTDITAPGVRTDITAPRGHSVPEGETDITAQGVQTDITAPGGHSVHEGGTDITAQGVRTDITAPGGHSVPEGGTDITAPGGHSVHEGDAKSQGSVDIRDKGFGKETLVAACYGGGSGFQQNQALLGAAVFAVTTVAEQRMMMQASGTDAEWDDDIISDEWLLSSEKQLPMDATPTGELSGAEEHQPSLSEDGACLMAGYRNQLKQSTASAEEANRAAVNKSPTSRNSQYPSGCIEVLSSAGLVGGQPPNRQRAELQEEAVQTTSWGAEKDEGRPGESVPGLSDAAVRHLVYHSSLQGGDRLEALSSSGPGQVDASPGMEQAEGKQSGSGHGSKQRSVGSNELSARVDSSDLSAAGFALKTELRCSCPGDPNAQEERVVRSSFAIAVQEAGDAGSICKTSGAGEKPGGSEDQELVGERHGKSKEPPAPEWKSRPSPVQAPQLPRIWTASLQEEPPRASPVFDNQQPQIRACSKAVPPLALVKPHALEDERLDGQKGEGLDERTNLVSEAMLSVGLRLPHEMGQEVDKDSTESDDSLADLAEAWSMGWILGNQVPDKSKNEATSSEQGDGLSMRADGFGPSTESSLPVSYNQIVTEIVISSITNPATGAGVDLSQTLAALGPNGQDLATKELLLDPCPQTQCSEVMSVPVEESSEDLQLEDRRPEENCDSSPPALPRDSDLLERPGFSKQAEVDPRCIAEEGNARESGGGEEFGTKSEMGRGATEETLGKKEVCVLSHIASYILKEGIGTIDTPMHCSHLSNNSRGTDKNLQQRPIVENPNEDPLEKCRSPNAVGQPRTESVDVCVFEQDSQEGKVIQPSEGKESSLPEVPLAEVSWGKPMAASVDSDVELETAEVSHQDLSGKKVENDNKVNLGLGADSTNIQLSLECLNVQPSESKSEEEDGAGSWRSNGLSHSGIRALKRPRASEVADSNSRATGPSKRSRTHQQIRGVGLRAAEGIKLSLQSFSKQLRQVRANYIGRLVQQFFTEYTPPWKRRVPKFVVVNRKDEVARIVKEFFEALSIQSKAKAVDKSQQSVKPIASQQPTCTVSELGQEPREGDESSQLEVYQKQEAQLESPCLIGRGLARTRGSGGASFLKEAGPSLTVDCPSSETSWRDRVGGDSEICPLQEGSGVAEESDTMQERSWHTKSEIISSSTHLGQISSAVVPGDIQDPATEDFGLSFCFTQDERVSAEKAEAFSACEMGPLLLPQCSSIAESPEQPGDDRCGENQSLGQKDTSCDGGTEEMACGGREPLSLEMPNSPLNPCGSALVECVEEGRTDERSSSSPAHLPADLAVDDDVTGVFQDGRSSSDSSTHSPALILDIHPPDLAEFSQIQEVPCHPGHNQDQCYKDVNVQPSALGFRKLLQTNSMDGLNVAQMACSNDEIKPNNASFDSSSNNKVEPINAMEPSVLHHKIVGQNDGNIGLKIAEPSALHSNGVAHGDNGVEPVNEEQLLIGQNNLSYSSTELECAKQSALAYGDLDHNDKGTNSVNSAEPSALAHNTSTSLTGGESAAPLGHCTEQQSSPSRLLEAETALQAAPSDRLELGQSLGGRRLWELPVPLRPDQRGDFGGKAGVMGCRSSGHSAREHQSRLAEPFRLPASQLSGREVKNLEGMASWNAVAKDPTRSERWESVGRFKSTEKPYLEMPRAAGAHRSRFNIDWRAHGEIFPGSQVAAETAGESLPASGVSSVPFAEDVKMEIGCAPADGVDFSSPDPFLPVGMPRARDCPEMLAKHRDMNPLLTDPRSAPRPAMSEQPAHQVVEGTRPDAGVAKEIGPRGWHSSPDCPSMAGCQQPASKSLLLSSSRGIGESGARVGYIGCERVGRENELRLKANNEENGSDREAGECACGQWSRATTPLAQPGCLPAASGVGNCLIAPTTSFAQPSRAPPSSNHNPSLPEDAPGATSWRSLEWNAVPSPLENPGVRFAALRNSTSTPTEALHPQPTQSSSAQPRCKSEPNLLSDTREQSFPVLSQDPPFHSDSQAFRLPNEPLSCGFGNKVPLPTAAEERVLYSKGILDQECSRDYTSSFCGLSSSSLGSDSDFSKGSHRPRHGEGNGGTRTQLYPSPSECDPCSSRNPARSEAIVRTRYRSAETVEGLQRSLLPEHQGEKGMETCKPCAPSARFLLPSPEHRWASSEQVIQSQLRECRLLLQHISEALQAEGVAEEHVAEWREQIKEMEKQTVAPLTYIAVVGDTGSGKSSLLNALLDEEGVLPTSAMRACTAVVVEVSLNTNSDHYTADVEFFSEEEWNKELLSLLSDMTDKSGRLRRRRPDPGSEASMAYSRVKAVYGKILLYQELKQFREVTQYLGTTTTIREMQASKFRSKVQRFIDTRNNDYSSSRGGEFWPIVKRVHIQVPKSAVLQTGAVLVDLPGVRDSNDARNSVAKEYLKTCDAVWIVANVTRAVDDKTAKETLDESLRRQLLMDGHFGCIAFICTKTDSHNVTEIMSALSLTDECSPLEERIAKLRKEIEQRQIDHKAWTSELERARGSNQNGERAKQLELAIKQLKVNLTELHSEVSVKQSELSLNSIRARNFFCKQKICLNFKRGLQDLKCQARAEDTDSDEEQEESDDDGDDDDEVPPSTADPRLESQLPVFTVSSTEYLKLRDKLQRDGPPRVFHNIEDTEIPAVQKFVHQITLARQALGAEVVIRKLATFVSHIVNYLTNRRAQNANYQAKVREALQDCLSRVREIFQQTAEDCRRDIENSFATIKMHLNMGKKKAMKSCEDTVLRWGSRPPIGYPYTTYKATCSRNGIFSSPACGSIDFNEELSRPLLTNLQVIWNQVFSMSVPQHLTRFKADVLGKLEYFFNNLLQRLKWIEGDTQPVNYILHQQLNAVRAKLENFALKLLDDITARQRSISRILTPAVQSGMMPTYLKSASESGPGCFMQMKSCMEQHMRFQKEQLFTNACRKLGDQLDILKQEIHSRLKLFLDEICNELLVQFEPLLKPLKIIDEIIPKLVSICRRTTAVCQRSHIDFTLPKIEENDEELEPATFLRKPLGSGTPPLQELKKFLGKVKIMQINQVEVTPTDPVEISLDKLLLKYKVPDTQILCEQPVPFQCLSVCEFCTSIPFLILTYKEKCKSKERTDVVLLDEEQAVFGQWMEAVAERWQGRLEFRCLEVVQGVERLRSLRVIYQGSDTKVPNEEKEEPCVWPRSNDDSSSSSSSSSSCVFVDIFPQSRKRQWGEMDPPGALPVPQGPSHWGQSSWINVETQTQPPRLKKERRDRPGSSHSQDWEYRLKPPVMKKEFCDSPADDDFDNL